MANDGFTTARKPLTGRLSSLLRRNGGKARNSSAPDDHRRELAAEQIRFLYRQLPPAMFTTTVIGALMVHVLWSNVDRLWLVLWLTAFIVVTLGRLAMMRSYLRANPRPSEAARWGHRFVIGVAVSGAIWGAAGIFPFKEPNLIHAMFMAFVLAGLSSGALSTLSSYRWAYIAFLLPALLPFTVRVMLQQGEVFVALSAMLMLFLVMMSIISLRYSASFAQSLRLRFDNLDLLDNLVAARDHQQVVNDALAAEMRERRQTEQALQAGNEVYRTLVDTTGTGYTILDAKGRVIDSNSVYIRLTGHRTLSEILGRSVCEWTAAHDIDRNVRELEKCLAVGYVRNLEIDYVDAAGKITPIEINATVIIAVGAPRFICLTRDIGVRKKTERALRHAYDLLDRKVTERTAQLAQANQILRTEKERFRVTLASIGDAVITTDAMAQIAYLNAVAEDLTGWSNLESSGRPITEVFRILDETTREPSEDPIRRCLQGNASIALGTHSVLIGRDGRELNVDASVAPIRDNDGATIGTVLIFRDVTTQRKLAQQLSHQATHDTLTGLVNRDEFERRLTHLLASATQHGPHALLYLDLDQFKVVNDTCGHVAGDELLRQVSALLRTKLRARDTLARLGGDEFGVLLEHCSPAEAKRVANTLRESLQGFRCGWQDKSFSIGVSIGLVSLRQSGETLSTVLSAADSSCYAAKEKGRNRVHVYRADDTMLAQRDGEMRWMPRIQQALADDRFRLYYQPIVAIAPGRSEEQHGEILLRMLDEEGHIVLPGAFLPAAERYGLMLAIDQWVVSKSLATLSAWDSGPNINFAINVSGQSLGSADFLEFVTDQITQTRIDPRKLCFEITETSAVSELTHCLRFIDVLKARGCRFSLDDFGTGISSFSYLKTMPVDYLKIDGGFINNLATDRIDREMVEAVHRIGHTMGLETIAECVHNNAILQLLGTMGVDYAQGYASGEPRPLNQFQRSYDRTESAAV